MKSRVKGDFQARFRENVRVKFPCVTRSVCEKTSVLLPSNIENNLHKNRKFRIFKHATRHWNSP
jgi:hypothetical protein